MLRLGPKAPSLVLGIAVAASFIVAEAIVVGSLNVVTGTTGRFGTLFLLGVLIVSMVWGFGLAMTMSVASALHGDSPCWGGLLRPALRANTFVSSPLTPIPDCRQQEFPPHRGVRALGRSESGQCYCRRTPFGSDRPGVQRMSDSGSRAGRLAPARPFPHPTAPMMRAVGSW